MGEEAGVPKSEQPGKLDYLNTSFSLIQPLVVLVGLFFTWKTLNDANNFAWRTFVDTKIVDLSKILLDKNAKEMRCIYAWG